MQATKLALGGGVAHNETRAQMAQRLQFDDMPDARTHDGSDSRAPTGRWTA
jgi:hypothetical protein